MTYTTHTYIQGIGHDFGHIVRERLGKVANGNPYLWNKTEAYERLFGEVATYLANYLASKEREGVLSQDAADAMRQAVNSMVSERIVTDEYVLDRVRTVAWNAVQQSKGA